MARTYETDLTNGPLLKKIILFALPIIGVNVLQLLFNTVDKIILGKFVENPQIGNLAVGAVGATSSLVNLIIGFFIGLSLSTNILIAKSVGQKNAVKAKRFIGTSVSISLIFGVILMIGGFFGAQTFLRWTGCDEELLDLATTYLRIYCLGMPVIMLYNFCASILRSVGDTLRPLIYLIIGGVVNVGLNIFFVTVCKMDIEGVAIATVASQLVSVILALIALIKSQGYARLERQYFRIYKEEFLEILKVGLPLGISKCLFSFSNVIMQSSINSLGPTVTTGSSVGSEFDLYLGEVLHAIAMTSLSFVSQNVGAKNMERVKNTIKYVLLLTIVVSVVISGLLSLLAEKLCLLIVNKKDANADQIIKYACYRIYIVGNSMVLCGLMHALAEPLRAMGKSFNAMIISLVGSCLLRILWLKTVFDLLFPTALWAVYIIYPISWAITAFGYAMFLIPTYKKLNRQFEKEKNQNEQVDGNGNG